MNRLIGLILFLVLLTIAAVFWINKPEIKNSDSEGKNIIAFGDSLVFGVGSTPGNDIFSLVSKDTNVSIINKGVSGNTTRDALARLKADVLTNNAKVVFVLFGGNDYLQKIPKEETFKNLSEIIEKIQDSGAAVVLIGVRGGIFKDRFEEDYATLAKKYKTGYVSNVLEGLITNREFMYDSIHPNDKGYKIIALRVSPILSLILENN